MNKGMYTSKTPEWSTPQDVFDILNKAWNFTLDPCATKENAKCAKFYTKNDDGLAHSWDGEKVFMNPPYGRVIGDWVKKASEIKNGVCVWLLPARTDTRWFHDYVLARGGIVEFLRGRLHFGDGKNPAPFPSMIVTFNHLLPKLAK